MNNLSLEQEVKNFLSGKGIKFDDKSKSYEELDFTIFYNQKVYFHLDAKEKRQKYNLNNWPTNINEPDLFIIDDLAVRKCLEIAPRSGIILRDNLVMKYYFFSVIDLALMPKVRVNRSIHKKIEDVKGKWLINLGNGVSAESIEDVFSKIRIYVQELENTIFKIKECYGNYVDENIPNGGITRIPEYWDNDVKNTR